MRLLQWLDFRSDFRVLATRRLPFRPGEGGREVPVLWRSDLGRLFGTGLFNIFTKDGDSKVSRKAGEKDRKGSQIFTNQGFG